MLRWMAWEQGCWQLAFNHALDVAFDDGDHVEAVTELLGLTRRERAAVELACTQCASVVAEWPDDADARRALGILKEALWYGDQGRRWREPAWSAASVS